MMGVALTGWRSAPWSSGRGANDYKQQYGGEAGSDEEGRGSICEVSEDMHK
jgi:hypothetical protein